MTLHCSLSSPPSTYSRPPPAGIGGGFRALVNVELICGHIKVMTQLGVLLDVREQLQMDTEQPPPDAVCGLLDVNENCYCSVDAKTIVFLLDTLHSMYGLHSLLTYASLVPPAEPVELHVHHSEASNETFFTHSMTSDCVVGTITQYAHSFAHLFVVEDEL